MGYDLIFDILTYYSYIDVSRNINIHQARDQGYAEDV